MTRYFINKISNSLYKIEKKKVWSRDRNTPGKWYKSQYSYKEVLEFNTEYFTEISEGEYMLEMI